MPGDEEQTGTRIPECRERMKQEGTGMVMGIDSKLHVEKELKRFRASRKEKK